jgi:branched-chain amino acid transport system permease protein
MVRRGGRTLTSILLVQILTGLAYGMLFFMVASGLTIIMGVLNIANLAHGSFFMIGAYVGYSVLTSMEMNFYVSIIISIAVTAAIGVIIERLLLRKVYGKELEQVLLTFGLTFIFADLVKWIWGSDMRSIVVPDMLNMSISIGDSVFPFYRLFIVFVGIALSVVLWYFESHTRIGAIIRAGVDDRAMVSALGINVGAVFTGVFAFGAGLAGLSGVLGGPLIGVYIGVDADIIVTSLIVLVIGGLGSWKGSLIAAIIVGLIETLGKVWFPSLSMIAIFLLIVLVLIIRPQGLLGKGAA